MSLTTIPSIFRDVYHQRVGIIGLHYIPLVRALEIEKWIVSNGVNVPGARLISDVPVTFKTPRYNIPLSKNQEWWHWET